MQVHLVVNFPMIFCKLNLDRVCDGNNILKDYRFIIKLRILLAL
jgi:hypothetical protein